MDKEATSAICVITEDLLRLPSLQAKQGLAWQIADLLYKLGYRRVICPECGHVRDEDRVRNGMKCSYCAGYGGK